MRKAASSSAPKPAAEKAAPAPKPAASTGAAIKSAALSSRGRRRSSTEPTAKHQQQAAAAAPAPSAASSSSSCSSAAFATSAADGGSAEVLEEEGEDGVHGAAPLSQLPMAEVTSRLQAAVDAAIDRLDAMEEASSGEQGVGGGGRGGDGGSMSAATATLEALRTLSTLLLSAREPAPRDASSSAVAAAPVSVFAAVISPATAASLVQSLRRCQERTSLVSGLLSVGPAEGKRDLQWVLSGLESALCTVLLLTCAGIDRGLMQENALTALFTLLGRQLLQHVLPCFDPLDAAWNAVGEGGEGTGGAGAAAGGPGPSGKKRKAAPPNKKLQGNSQRRASAGTGRSRSAGGSDGEEEDGGEGDGEEDGGPSEGDLDLEELEGHHRPASGGRKGAAAPASQPAQRTVTKAMVTAAQARMRPIILVLAEVLRRMVDLVPAVTLDETLLAPLMDVCMLAATQANSHSAALASSTARARASAGAGASSAGAESALQLSGMSCLQAVFERYPAQRPAILRELLNVHVRTTGGKRARLGFAIAPSVPRLYLTQAGGSSSGGGGKQQGSGAAAADVSRPPPAVAGPANPAEEGRITTCTALLCFLLHSSASLPSPAERAIPAAAASPAAAAAAASAALPLEEGAEKSSKRSKKGGGKLAAVEEAAAAAVEVPAEPAPAASSSKSGKGKKGGAKANKAAKAAAAAASSSAEEALAVHAAPAAPSGPVPARAHHSHGFLEALRLGASYTAQLLAWCGRVLAGEATGLGPSGGGGAADEEADPKLVLRRYVEDLLAVFDLPEWPGAETLLWHTLRALLDIIASASGAKGAGGSSGSAPSPAEKALVGPAISLVGTILTRLHQCRGFAAENAMLLTSTGPINLQGRPLDDGEIFACPCGLLDVDGAFMLDCDSCHRWFHSMCVGLGNSKEAHTPDEWICDDCELRKLVEAQCARLSSRSSAGVVASNAAAAASDGAGSSVATPLVLRQLVLNFVTERAYDDAFARLARRFVVARWASDAWSKSDDDTSTYAAEQWALPTRAADASRRPPLLSPYGTQRIVMQVMAGEPLLASVDDLLRRLLSSFDSGEGSKTRAALMKAVGDIVRACPAAMSSPAVARVVGARLRDASKLVRAEALELVGRYVTTSPALVSQFYETLLEKLGDDGVSVRKKVVGIFRDLLARRMLSGAVVPPASVPATAPAALSLLPLPADPTLPVLLRGTGSQTIRVLLTLLRLAGDEREEESVRDAVQDLFEWLWFAPPAAALLAAPSLAQAAQPALVDVLREAEDGSVAAAAPGSVAAAAPGSSSSSKQLLVRATAGGAGAARLGDQSAATAAVVGEVQARAGQIVTLLALAGPAGTKWFSDMLARITATPAAAAGEADPGAEEGGAAASGSAATPASGKPPSAGGGAGAAGRSSRKGAAASSSTVNIPGFGPWGRLSVCGALVEVLHGGLLALSDRKAALMSAEHLAPAAASAAVATYARELLGCVTALHAFAAVRPSLLGPQCLRSLAPFLKGDALLQLGVGRRAGGAGQSSSSAGPAANEALLARVAGVMELALSAASSADVTGPLIRDIETDLLALMVRGSPAVMRAAAAALGVLASGVTLDDSRLLAAASRTYASLLGLRDARLASLRRAAAAHAPQQALSAEAERVLWLRDVTPTLAGGSPDPVHRGIVSGLYSLCLLARFCDLDRNVEAEAADAQGGGAPASAAAASSASASSSASGPTGGGSKRRRGSSAVAGGEQDAPGSSSSAAAASSSNKRSKGQEGKAVAASHTTPGPSNAAGASPVLVTPQRQVTGALAYSGGGIALAETLTTGTASSSSSSGAQPPGASALPRGGGALALVHGLVAAYAHAALKLSRAAHAKVLSASAPARASSSGSGEGSNSPDNNGPASGSMSRAFDTAREVLRGYEAVALKAVRGLGFLAARCPESLLWEGTSSALSAALLHPLPALREAGILVLTELLGVPEERPAVAAAMVARSRRDAARVANQRAAGFAVTDAALLASAAGGGLRAALLHPPHGTVAAAAAAGASSEAPASSSKAGGAPSLADHDGAHSSLVSGTVRAHFPAVRALLYDATEENTERHVNGGVGGMRVRLAATQLLAQVVRHGVVDSDSCVAPLIALTTDESAPVAAIANAQLLSLAEKAHPRVEAHAVAGVLESFRFQMAVLGEATARPPVPLDPVHGLFSAPSAGPPPPPPTPFLAAFFTRCMAHSSRGRFTLLRSLVQRIIPDMLPGTVAPPSSSSSAAVPASSPASASSAATSPADAFTVAGRRRQGGGDDGELGASSAAAGFVLDVSLARYLAETLMFLPYAKEEEVLTVLAYANRGVAVHADDLLTSLHRYTGPAALLEDSKEHLDGVEATSPGAAPHPARAAGAPLPARGTPAYAALAAQAGFAFSLALLLQAKRFLKAAYDVKDARVREFDPTAAASSGGAGSRGASAASSASADRSVSMDPSVAVSDRSVLELPPEGLEAALLAACAPAPAPPHSCGAAALTPALLAAAAACLEEQLSLTADDFATKIHALSFAHKRRISVGARKSRAAAAVAVAEGEGGMGDAAAAASSSAKPKKAPRKRKARAKRADGDDDSDVEGGAGEEYAGGSGGPVRQSGRARKAGVSYAELNTQAAGIEEVE